jgi:hypothetical protein
VVVRATTAPAPPRFSALGPPLCATQQKCAAQRCCDTAAPQRKGAGYATRNASAGSERDESRGVRGSRNAHAPTGSPPAFAGAAAASQLRERC